MKKNHLPFLSFPRKALGHFMLLAFCLNFVFSAFAQQAQAVDTEPEISTTGLAASGILTPSGLKSASDLVVGDHVIGFDAASGGQVTNTIEKIELITPAYYNYWEQDGEGSYTSYVELPFPYIVINGKYRLFKDQSVFANGRVVHASEIHVGDIMLNSAGKNIVVTSIGEDLTHPNWVKLSVSGNHSYIADGLILHNASRYWVGGGSSANWSATGNTNWGSVSNTRDNASVPGPSDDVIFDGVGFGASNSTISASISINSLDMTGYANTMTHNSAVTLTIAGNTFKLSSGMTYARGSNTTSAVSFTSTTGISGAPTLITTNGKTLGNVTTNGLAGYFKLQDDLLMTTTATLTHTAGTFDAGDRSLSVGLFSSSNSNARVINMGSGTWTLTGASNIVWNTRTQTGLAKNPGTSTVIFSGTNQALAGANTFYNLTKTTAVTDMFSIDENVTQTIMGALTLQGAANQLLLLRSWIDSTFASRVNYASATGPRSVVSSDVNSDGRQDLIVGNVSSVSVFIGNGDGTFVDKVDYAVNDSARSIAVGDLNGDTKPDIVVPYGTVPGTMYVLLNNGNGTFATAVPYSCASNCLGASLGDLDKDGDLDVVAANWSGNTVSIFMNNGNGTFAGEITYAVRSHPRKIAIADFDHDTYPDLAVSNDGAAYVSVLLNNGNGTFAAKVDYAANGNSASYNRGVAVADVDGDTYADILLSTQTSFSVFRNNGNGTFAAEVAYSHGFNNEDVQAGDVNGDGYVDAVLTSSNTSGGVTLGAVVYLNNGKGAFSIAAQNSTATGASSQMSALGDFDGDGYLDIATANEGTNNVSVFINQTGPQWGIDPQGTRTISYLSVKDSNNINATPIAVYGFNITNSGNNTNWIQAPALTTASTTDVVATGATFHGAITNTGSENPTQHGFVYATSADFSTNVATTSLGAYSGTGSLDASVISLAPATTYYVRSYATNSGGTGYGNIESFTTLAAPAPITVVPGSQTAIAAPNLTYAELYAIFGDRARHPPSDPFACPLGALFNASTGARCGSLAANIDSFMPLNSSSTHSFSRDLSVGMTNEEIRLLQRYLNSRGFPVASFGFGSAGKETPYFGPATRNALIRFQRANKISPAIGYFGPVTRQYVNSR